MPDDPMIQELRELTQVVTSLRDLVKHLVVAVDDAQASSEASRRATKRLKELTDLARSIVEDEATWPLDTMTKGARDGEG